MFLFSRQVVREGIIDRAIHPARTSVSGREEERRDDIELARDSPVITLDDPLCVGSGRALTDKITYVGKPNRSFRYRFACLGETTPTEETCREGLSYCLPRNSYALPSGEIRGTCRRGSRCREKSGRPDIDDHRSDLLHDILPDTERTTESFGDLPAALAFLGRINKIFLRPVRTCQSGDRRYEHPYRV